MEDQFRISLDQPKISLNMALISLTFCHFHKDVFAEYLCTHTDCINQSICFICELCFKTHSSDHLGQNNVVSTQILFSTRLLEKAKVIVKTHETELDQDIKFQEAKTQINNIFIKFEARLVSMMKGYCDQAQKDIQAILDPNRLEYEKTLKIISEYEDSLTNIFSKDDLPEFQTYIFKYLQRYQNLTDVLQSDFAVKSSKKISNQDSCNLTERLFKKNDDLYVEIDNFIKQKMRFFEEDIFNNTNNLMERLNSLKLHKEIPRTHTGKLWKMIFSSDFSKNMTSSEDSSIVIRNTSNDRVIQTLKEHQGGVYHLLTLADGRLVSASEDRTLKIWSIETGQCIQTLLGHTSSVYCSFQLSDSVLISGSDDKTLKTWNLNDKSNILKPKHSIPTKDYGNWCICSIKDNEFAASSLNDINIFKYDLNENAFEITRKLQGHKCIVRDIKLIKSIKYILISCSDDKTIKLWDVFQNSNTLLKTFSGHSLNVMSLLVISEEIFISGGFFGEVNVWNINQNEKLYQIDKKQLENKHVYSICKLSKNSFACSGNQEKIYFFKY